MRWTTVVRRNGWLLLLCLAVTVVGALLVIWPPMPARGNSALDADLAVVAPMHEALSESAFVSYLAARGSPDLERGIEYTLQLSDGAVPLGQLPASGLRRSSKDGFFEYERAEQGSPKTRVALKQCFADGDCLIIGERVDLMLARFRHPIGFMLAAFLAALGIVIARSAYRFRLVSEEFRRLEEAVKRLLSGDLAQRLPAAEYSDYAVITVQLNRLLERIEHLTFATRTVIDSTAHDLRTPLYRLRSRLEQGLLPGQTIDKIEDAVEGALHEVDGIEATLDALLRITLAESGSASMAPVNLAEVATDVIELYRPIAEDKEMRLTTDFDFTQSVNGNAQLLAQALANLLDNAIKYTPRGGEVDVKVARRSDEIVVIVADSGPGIPATDRARAMERSRRLANAAGTAGSGLGLALVVAVARLHGGRLLLGDNHPGLVAELSLPG